MDKNQIADIERRMQEEHRKDLEALARLKRFIPTNGATSNGASKNTAKDSAPPVIYVGTELPDDGASLKSTIRDIMNSDPGIRWTNPKMLSHLQKIGYDLKAKRPIYSIGQATGRLAEKGEIVIVRKGSGNEPNVYRGLTLEEQQKRETASENKE